MYAVIHTYYSIYLISDMFHGKSTTIYILRINNALGRVGAVESVCFMCEAIRTITFSPFQTNPIVWLFCEGTILFFFYRHKVAMELMDGVVFGIDIVDHVEGMVFDAVGCSGLGLWGIDHNLVFQVPVYL